MSALGEGRATLLHLYRTLLVWLVVLLALGWVAGPERVALFRGDYANADFTTIPTDAQGWIALAASWLVTLLLPALVAIAAHRSFLLGEQEKVWLGLFRREMWRYGWRAFLVFLVVTLQTLLALAPVLGAAIWIVSRAHTPDTPTDLGARAARFGTAFGIVSGLIWTLFFCRFAPWLPAAAIGERTMTMRGAWRATRGRGLRSLAIVVGTVLPFILVLPTTEGLLLDGLALTPVNGPRSQMIIHLVMLWLEPVVLGAFLAAAISALYRAATGLPPGGRVPSAATPERALDPSAVSAAPSSR